MSDTELPKVGEARRRRIAMEEAQKVTDTLSADQVGGEAPAPSRRKRRPFGSVSDKLRYPDRAGYHRHWFNDVPGRLEDAKDAGYEQVHDEKGRPVKLVVGVARGGGSLEAYLHEIPQAWYDEDMAAQDEVVHERLGQIKRGEYQRPGGREGQLHYAGSDRGGISIQEGNRR